MGDAAGGFAVEITSIQVNNVDAEVAKLISFELIEHRKTFVDFGLFSIDSLELTPRFRRRIYSNSSWCALRTTYHMRHRPYEPVKMMKTNSIRIF